MAAATWQNNFTQVYNNLNPQQKQAVDAIEGAVMVIAGPGTGKTQILSARIANILLKTDAAPENILCLTYTDAGVIAMRKRLLKLIGTESYKVQIHTFHSFCNLVIQENADYFDKREMTVIDDLQKINFVQNIIDGFDKNNPLKKYKNNTYNDTQKLLSLYATIKKENFDPQTLIASINNFLTEEIYTTEALYSKTAAKKGERILTAKGKEETRRYTQTIAAINTFTTYVTQMQKAGVYDYEDMIQWVIKIFNQEPDVLLNYQERFQYVLVDEYQDTNGAQNEIVRLLLSYWQAESPNIFVVGDDDQSIYRFQGASLSNMMGITKLYTNLTTVALTKNYRSAQVILDAAKTLIENNTVRLINQFTNLNKNLQSANSSLQNIHNTPEFLVFKTDFEECIWIAKKIQQLINDGVPAGKIAVLYAKHSLSYNLVDMCQAIDIPVYSKKQTNLFEDVFADKIFTLLNYFAQELDVPFSGDPCLFEILHYPFFNVPPLSIAKLCTEINSMRGSTTAEKTLRHKLSTIAQQNKATLFAADENQEKLVAIHTSFELLLAKANELPLQQWFELLIYETGIVAYILANANKHELMAKLTAIFDVVKQTTAKQPLTKLKDFCAHLSVMQQEAITLPFTQNIGNEDGVNFLTAHGSKGLEFEHVFIMQATSNNWEARRGNNNVFVLPPSAIGAETATEKIEEIRRLFYVAVTRAEKNIYITYASLKNDGKENVPSQFAIETAIQSNSSFITTTISKEDITNFSAFRFGLIKKPVLATVEADYINKLLKSFKLSTTSLSSYLKCPVHFYFNTLIRIPAAKSQIADFGTAVHNALHKFYSASFASKQHGNKQMLLDYFANEMYKQKEDFTSVEFKSYLEYGTEILGTYYTKYIIEGPHDNFYQLEYTLEANIDGVPIKGFADKIEFFNKEIVITDYKTGKPENRLKYGQFDLPGSTKMPHGGDYWRQAVFYKIAINQSKPDWKVRQVIFDYVEQNDKKELIQHPVAITLEDEAAVKEQIKTTWQRIQNHEFYEGCGAETCNWCNFVKNNTLQKEIIETYPDITDFDMEQPTM
jgi:DNA helicase II / ATP-dependent DNA helicase PcrA